MSTHSSRRSAHSRHWLVLAALLAPLSVLAQDAGAAAAAPADPAAAAPAAAEPLDCAQCHDDVHAKDKEHAKLTCQKCHADVKDEDHMEVLDAPDAAQKLCEGCHEKSHAALVKGSHDSNSCQDCHGSIHKGDFARVNTTACETCHEDQVKALATSVHAKEATCSECHGDVHNPRTHKDPLSPTSAVMQVESCTSCHDSKGVKAFRHSVHGQGVLGAGLSVAPSCSSCHGAHDILKVDDPTAKVSRQNITKTCGNCHTFIEAQWKDSVHGQLFAKQLAEGTLLTAPKGEQPAVCTNCHSAHETFDPNLPGGALKMSEGCAQCHASRVASWKDSFHGKASMLGFTPVATCHDCHTAHRMLSADDAKSTVHEANLTKTCGECHPGADPSFAGFKVHVDPKNKEDSKVIHYVWLAMTSLLVGTLAFFALHTLLWFQRALVGFIRKEFHFPHNGEKYVRRFRPVHMWVHVCIILTFLALAATGLPLKFSLYEGAKPMIALFGGPGAARVIHRIAGVLTFGYGLFFLGYLFREIVLKKRRELLFGWQSMVPNKKDLVDIRDNIKWFLYQGPRPKLDRWAYWEKFDFLAVFWGVIVIGLSGLMLWFPVATAKVFPGWALNLAYIIHGDEALLATGFIFFFHFFHTHLRPESFPLDPVIFTGSVPLERFMKERPTEYERLVASGKLEESLVPGPTERVRMVAYVFGFTALTLGILLGAFLIYAGIHGLMH